MDNITIYGEVDRDLEKTVQFLRQRNVGVVIREERDLNVLHLREKRAISHGKGKGKENEAPSCQVAPNENVTSKAALAQRARRERERNEMSSARQLAQRNRRDRERLSETNQSVQMGSHHPSLMNRYENVTGVIQSRFALTDIFHNAQTLSNVTRSICETSPRQERDEGCSFRQLAPIDEGCSVRQLAQRKRRNRELLEERNHPTESRRRRLTNSMVTHSLVSSTVNTNHMNTPIGGTSPIHPELLEQEHFTAETSLAPVNLIRQMDRTQPPIHPARHFLGSMNVSCPHCSALHWMEEKLTNSPLRNPLFGTCCLQGKIRLPLLNTPPPLLQALYDGSDVQSTSFRRHIREYNATNAFTSLGVKMDPRVLSGRGPTSFTIHGELRHQTGSLLPEPGQEPVYAQLYIYDPANALEVRTRRNPHLRSDVLETIQNCLLQFNAFSNTFRQACAILNTSNLADHNVPAYLHYNSATDRRRYNLPTSDDIALILPGDGTELSGLRDIVLHLRGTNGLMRISECHPAYLPLHYVLLFPHGELGWEPDMKQWDVLNGRPATNKRLTQMEFYSYRLFERHTEYSTILRAGKLFQEFIVDGWAATEQNRLTFYKLNQKKLRVELYDDLTTIAAEGLEPDQVGQRKVLPSSFIGGPRHMFEIFQDSMAITRYNRHPDIFLTMTANPKWPEITAALLPHQTAADRPDLVARVFELKRKALMKEVDQNRIFGKKVAHVYTIEFQKRGLPHMHVLFFLEGQAKIRTCDQVDKLVCAEFPDPNKDPELFETIKNCMVHGPCGDRNPNAPCMENGKCTKRYPRAFSETTTMDQDGYPIYRRRDNCEIDIIVRGHKVDNRDVVPYNEYLSRMFDCHINVEVCAGLRCVKYIHKYIYKGGDRATMVLEVDEIKQYLDSRYIGPPEAAWRIFGHSLHEEIPTVVRLAVHLPGMHRVVYNPSESIEVILARAALQTSTLTAFFACCASNEAARAFTYQEFPQHFVWKSKDKRWEPRNMGYAIGRMYHVSPNAGATFYLRMLLTVVKGPQSYECLRTFNNILYPTFKDACIARGLLEDDGEWIQCLQEAAIMRTGYQLRRLFSIILMQCCPQNPHALWNQFSMDICDDLAHKLRTSFAIPNPTEAQIQDYGLYLLNQLLQESGKSLADFPPMPQPSENWNIVIGNKLIWEHRQLQFDAQQSDAQINVNRLNDAQHASYTAIITSVIEDKGITFFVSGGAGTGKTFLYNTVAKKIRSIGHIVVTVASSGIASLLLVGGRTAHSTFSIPLDVLENSFCGFTKQSPQAELFRATKLIIWDEVPMQHRHCVEAVDRTLQDIRDCKRPFGGITVVLGGDFRQILPVVPRGVREQIVGASLRRSDLWNDVHVLTLDVNMRLNSLNSGNANYAQFLNEIGTKPEENVQLPSSIGRCENMDELLSSVYPELSVAGTVTPSFLTERTILSARNDDVSAINNAALNIFPGETFTYLAADKISDPDEIDQTIANRYPTEYLNTLDPNGLPPFKLELKVGCPIILLRNIAPKDGLCNGTRLMVLRCASRVIECQILTGDKSGSVVFIPRISLTPSSSDLPFKMTRRQFPARLAYSVMINKSQGQSVNIVGVDLRNPVFSHGQLYVALSRCTNFDCIYILLEDGLNSTNNIVYTEVLL